MNGLKQSVDDIKKEFPMLSEYESISLAIQLSQARQFSMIAECVVSSTVSKGNSAMSTTKISR